MLGRSGHPATLGAMLLADYVFAQSPRALTEVATALSTHEALRRLTSGRTYRGDQGIQIPDKCGGSEIVSKAFEFLFERHTPVDLGRRLATFIALNSTSQEIDAQWMAQKPSSEDLGRWLSIGRELESLSRVDKSAIVEVLGTDQPPGAGTSNLKTLCEAGRFDCILTSDENATALKVHLLSTYPWRNWGWEKTVAPLYLLPLLFSSSQMWLAPRSRIIIREFRQAITKFRSGIESDIQVDFPIFADFQREAFHLSCKIADIFDDSAGGLTVSAWQSLIEECRTLWGEQPAILAAAANLSRNLPRSRSRKEINLLDRNLPIGSRMRFAKSQARNLDWWKKQLLRSKNVDDMFLCNMAYWSFTPVNLAFELADVLTESLEEMPRATWEIFLNMISSVEGIYFYYHQRSQTHNTPLPTLINSSRLALMIGFKDRLNYGRAVFLDNLMASNDRHPVVAEFRQSQAFEAAVSGALDWGAALSIIRSTYADSAAHQVSRVLGRRGDIFPEVVLQQILANAKDYPVQLWDLAESAASASARKAIRPVGTIARKDRWFAD